MGWGVAQSFQKAKRVYKMGQHLYNVKATMQQRYNNLLTVRSDSPERCVSCDENEQYLPERRLDLDLD